MVDYKGQQTAERIMLAIFLVFCTPAWIYGYFEQDFTYPLYACGVATALACLVRIISTKKDSSHVARWSFPTGEFTIVIRSDGVPSFIKREILQKPSQCIEKLNYRQRTISKSRRTTTHYCCTIETSTLCALYGLIVNWFQASLFCG